MKKVLHVHVWREKNKGNNRTKKYGGRISGINIRIHVYMTHIWQLPGNALKSIEHGSTLNTMNGKDRYWQNSLYVKHCTNTITDIKPAATTSSCIVP